MAGARHFGISPMVALPADLIARAARVGITRHELGQRAAVSDASLMAAEKRGTIRADVLARCLRVIERAERAPIEGDHISADTLMALPIGGAALPSAYYAANRLAGITPARAGRER